MGKARSHHMKLNIGNAVGYLFYGNLRPANAGVVGKRENKDFFGFC